MTRRSESDRESRLSRNELQARTAAETEEFQLHTALLWCVVVYAVVSAIIAGVFGFVYAVMLTAAMSAGIRLGLPSLVIIASVLIGLWGTIRMLIGAVGCLSGKSWGLELLRNASILVALSAACFFICDGFVQAMGASGGNLYHISMALGKTVLAASLPIIVLAVSDKHYKPQGEMLRVQRRKDQGLVEQGSIECPKCRTRLNTVTGDGIKAPNDEPWKVVCANCQTEVDATDAV